MVGFETSRKLGATERGMPESVKEISQEGLDSA